MDWPAAIQAIYDRHVTVAGKQAMLHSFGHLWEDGDFEREHIEWCLNNYRALRLARITESQQAAVMQSLRDLLLLPKEVLP